MDHYHQIPSVGPDTDPMLEAYTALAGVAARTHRIKLGAMVTGVTYRNPAFLAKVVTTLDIVSSGRAILGIGAAWNEVESRAYGYEWPSTAERFERLEDALQICRGMFTHDRTTFDGSRHSVDGAINVPQPVQPGGPKILIGGTGERKTLRLVAQYADMWNGFGDPSTVRHKLAVLGENCRDIGRDRSEIETTRLGTPITDPAIVETSRAFFEAWSRRHDLRDADRHDPAAGRRGRPGGHGRVRVNGHPPSRASRLGRVDLRLLEREDPGDGGSRAGRARDFESPTQGIEPVGHALQAGPVGGRPDVEASSVVGHLEAQLAIVLSHSDGRSVRTRVLRDVVQRLEATEVHRGLDRLVVASVAAHLDGDRDRCLASLRLEGGPESLVGEQRRIDAPGEVAQIFESSFGVALDVAEQAGALGRVSLGELLGEPGLDGEGDQLLLGAVVEVALDPPSLLVLRGDESLS
jgi:F420-dependent oxidoreductase-like protein